MSIAVHLSVSCSCDKDIYCRFHLGTDCAGARSPVPVRFQANWPNISTETIKNIRIFQILECVFFVLTQTIRLKSFVAKPFKTMMFILCRLTTIYSNILTRTVALSYYLLRPFNIGYWLIGYCYTGEFLYSAVII